MAQRSPRHVAIIGAGPAGLMAAETITRAGLEVTVYERMASPARKLLLAGRGGLNLTHSEPLEIFLTRYREAEGHLKPAILAFSPDELTRWANGLGEETFVGTSGRVFPKSMKTSPLLRAWLKRLGEQGVTLKTRHRWLGWTAVGHLLFATPEGEITARPDATILALGGASWPQLGADGSWVSVLAEHGHRISPLRPANAGFLVRWSEVLKRRFAGAPLKRIGLSFRGEKVRGEAVITAKGLEGGAVYALSAPVRDAVLCEGSAQVLIDLRPDLAPAEIAARLEAPRGKQSMTMFLRKALSLAPQAIALLQEAAHAAATPLARLGPAELADLVKALPIPVTGIAPIARAISTAGGLAFDDLDANLMLVRRPGTFVAGEMLDWEAPTGGYLLQASFSTGALAANGALSWLSGGASA